MKKISDIIQEILVKHNIELAFGIIGSAISHLYDSINNSGRIKIISMHHQQAVVMAMGAYYRATGKLAVAIITAGAGSSNASTGILSNWGDSIPGLIILGQEQTYYLEQYKDRRMYGIQGFDALDSYKKYVKKTFSIRENNVYQDFKNAFRITEEGRPGPVLIELPFDIQGKSIYEQEIIIDQIARKKPNKSQINKIVEFLNQSKRPLVMIGQGVRLSKANKEIKKFVQTYNIPTILTWSAVDVISENHPNYFGRTGVSGHRYSNLILQNCDLLLVLGSRLSLLQTGYDRNDFARFAKIIQIDIDQNETNKFDNRKEYIKCNCDVKLLIHELNQRSLALEVSDQWINYCQSLKNKYPLIQWHHSDQGFTNTYKLIQHLSQITPQNYIITTDMGTGLLGGFYSFKIKQGQQMFTSLGLAQMGYGLPGAIGASYSGNPVLCLNCDGGIMMNLQQLQTIIANKLPIKIVIFNNDGYLMIRHTQNMLFNGRRVCVNNETGVSLPDFKKLAYAFGFQYYTQDSMQQMFNNNNPAFLQIFMHPQQPSLPKVIGHKREDDSIISGLLEQMSPPLSLQQIKSAMISGINPKSLEIKR